MILAQIRQWKEILMITSVLYFEAPRDRVFAVLTDYPRYKEWFPGCEDSAVVSSMEGSVDAEFVINMVKRVRVGMRFEAQATHVLKFHMVHGKDLRSYSGSYRLVESADGKGTTVFAEMKIDVGAMVPQFIVDYFAKKSIDDTGRSLRRYIGRQTTVQSAHGPADCRV